MPAVAIRSTLNHEVIGPQGAPLVVALGGISASRHVARWWGDVVGDARSVDTTRFQVVGVDYLDGGVGDDGRPAWAVTTHDQADALARVLDDLAIERIHTFIGASYGGMVALAFAERYPERVDQLVIISAPAQPHPFSTCLRAIQRRIVELGLQTGRELDAVTIARALAMTTYRSADEFAARFSADPFSAECYVIHHGERFARRFSSARYLALSLSCDLHRVDPHQIRTPALLVAADGDTIVPRDQMVDLAARWGGPSRLVHVPTLVGHDAFVAESASIGAIIRDALTSSVLA